MLSPPIAASPLGRAAADFSNGDARSIASRLAALDWTRIAADLDAHGCAVTGAVLTPAQCRALAASYPSDALFRSRVIMARHGFGRGEYKYFADPLPPEVAALRAALYPPLATIANRWNAALDVDAALSRRSTATFSQSATPPAR